MAETIEKTLIERAEIAVIAELQKQMDRPHPDELRWVEERDGFVVVDGPVDMGQVICAILTAIRVPSDVMIDAAEDKGCQNPRATAKHMWSSMIDAMLEECS